MKIVCPHCQVKGTVADGLLGKKVRCPECSNVFRVTEDVTIETPPVEALTPVVEDVAVEEPEAAPEIDDAVTLEEDSVEAVGEPETLDESEDVVTEGLPEGVEVCSRCGFVFSEKYIEKQDTISFCTLCALPLDESE